LVDNFVLKISIDRGAKIESKKDKSKFFHDCEVCKEGFSYIVNQLVTKIWRKLVCNASFSPEKG
jgi:ribosomal protein L37AE/L43A